MSLSKKQQIRRELQRFIDKPRVGWILNPTAPRRSEAASASKFGGAPYAGEITKWPECRSCSAPLNFILQLHRRRFPQMWFPKDRNLFQVFRCPNAHCKTKKKQFDRYMLTRFVKTTPGPQQVINRPDFDPEDDFDNPEIPISERQFQVTRIRDYPSGYEGREAWWGASWRNFQAKHVQNDFDKFKSFSGAVDWNLIKNVSGIKIAGLPSWQQGGNPPKCSCGRVKEFVFQLSSVFDPTVAYWRICIGDAGNIYFFVCRRCGESSWSSLWDCG